MEPTSDQELSFEEGLAQVMQGLPGPIRDYLRTQAFLPALKAIGETYKLHVDQVGILEREITLFLIGAETPEEFVGSFQQETGLSQEIVGSIVKDANDKIFAPLQQAMQKQTGGGPKPQVPAQPEPVVPVLSQKPQGVAAPMAAPKPIANLSGTPLADALKRAGAMNPSPAAAPKPEGLLEDHEEPHIEVGNRRQATGDRGTMQMPPKPVAPQVPAQPASAATTKPQWNVPLSTAPAAGAVPGERPHGALAAPSPAASAPQAPSTPAAAPKMAPPAPAQPPQTQTPPASPAPKPSAPDNKYSTDPYREPLDGAI